MELRYTLRLVLAPGHGGPNPGNIHVLSGALQQGAATAGAYRGFCIVTDPGPSRLQCNVTAEVFGRGEVTSVGSVGPGGRGTMVVADGTGAFRGVRGTRTVENPPRSQGGALFADVVYRLERPR